MKPETGAGFGGIEPESGLIVFPSMPRGRLELLRQKVRASGLKILDESWTPDRPDRPEGAGRLVLRLEGNELEALALGPGSGPNVGPGEIPFQSGRLTPTQAGLSMPAEWAPHAGCWMAWPCRESLWGDRLEAARSAFAHLARVIARFEPVTMLARPEHLGDAAARCGGRVTTAGLPIDDSWTRDTGPSFVAGRQGVAGVDWIFNGYGNVYADHAADDSMARAVCRRLNMRCFEAPLVLEGGAFHVDGQGAVLVTEECLLNSNRNPHLTRVEVEEFLCEYLGADRVIWLGRGLTEDETSGHVSNAACFIRPGRVLLQVSRDPAEDYYWSVQDNIERLRAARDARGRTLEVVEVEEPQPRPGPNGRRLPLSYVNFYPANNALIIPQFDDPADRPARILMENLFPDREIVPVPALEIVRGGGGLHCATLQQPLGTPIVPGE